jgi:VanZ family protein
MLLESQSPSARRGPSLAGTAALAYSLLIIYASLQPFSGWRAIPAEFGIFLFEAWPRWITFDDVLFNFIAYAPLGFLIALALRARWSAPAAVAGAAIAGALLSGALETAQQYLPSRIASNVDLLVNVAGATAGALLAPLLSPQQRLGRELAQLRGQWFVDGLRGDAVLVLAGLWLLAQLHTPAIAFGNGDLRESFSFALLFPFSPQAYFAAEAGVVALNAAGLGLLLAGAMREPGPGYWRTLALLFGLASALKAAAALLLLQAPNPWSWLTPGVLLGLACGMALLLLLIRLPPRGRNALALLALAGAVILINGMPENPYRPVAAYLLQGKTSHILSFASMLSALSELWPFLAMLCTLLSLPARDRRPYGH